MAKFAIECPKCGSVNTASTFIFAKKIIECGSCGEEINIKQSRLTSKVCPHCEKVFVCDQAKTKGKKCPSCGMAIDVAQAATAEYKMVNVNCPQCACSIEVDKTKDRYFCPICDCQLDVKKELAKAKLVSDIGVSVIQYEGDNSTFVWKHPIEDFNLGSQLIVHESQEAIFFLNGEALDTFGPGRHTLETENLPVLKKIYSLPTGSQTPFHAEVYFINQTVQMGIKWGTPDRVRYIDPLTSTPLEIGASGEMNLAVSDSRKLLSKLVGTMKGISWEEDEEKGFTRSLQSAFRPMITNAVKTNLSQAIKANDIDIFEIDEKLDLVSEALRKKITAGFEEYGLTVPQLFVTGVSLPDDDPNFKSLKELHTVLLKTRLISAHTAVETARAQSEAQIEKAKRETEMQRQTTETEIKKHEAQRKYIDAKSEAEANRMKGLAEADVMRAKGYSEKDLLEAEVQKAYAEGMGNMGGGNGTAGGGMASDFIGMMAGMKMANTMFDKMDGMFGDSNRKPAGTVSGLPTWSCSCGEDGNTKKFCMSCGKPKPEPKAALTWTCPVCGESDNTKGFCMNCGAKKPENNAAWNCPECGETGNTKNFCMNCGAKKPE